MLCRRYQVFAAWTTLGRPATAGPQMLDCHLGCSQDLLGMDRLLSTLGIGVRPLTPPLPIAAAHVVLQSLSDEHGLPLASSIIRPALGEAGILSLPSQAGSATPPVAATPLEPQVSLFAGLLTLLGLRPGSGPGRGLRPIEERARFLAESLGYPGVIAPAAFIGVPEGVGSLLEPSALAGDLERVMSALGGRCLYRHELLMALRAAGRAPYGHLDMLVDILVNSGVAVREPSVKLADGAALCARCGSTSTLRQVRCPICRRDDCWSCAECRQMGEARACVELIMAPAPAGPYRRPDATLPGPAPELTFAYGLTKPQEDSSAALRGFAADKAADGERECLVWAVCGAGKTEVAFSAVHEALRRGRRVLFAIPRRDVVLELEPRLKAAFGWTDLAVLYGGCQDTYRNAQLVLATTHQVLRLYGAFDLAVVDEADAFPFLGSGMLRHAVSRAMSPVGRLVYMTATPDRVLMSKADRGLIKVVTISARHHGKPLPEPELMSAALPEPGGGRLSGGLPDSIAALVWSLAVDKGDPVFVFAPTVAMVAMYGQLLAKALPEVAVATCHSSDPERGEKREAFQRGDIRVLVSTSIMERGITVKGCGAIVLNADFDRIYDDRSLVQMAGRAGRSTDRPDGSVVFVGRSVNREMRLALEHIRGMNDEARARGYVT